ncbi:MAG: hypothetical protein IIY72_03450 [Solobacterium sp.]|nr:hypothetical protein [Solobacterium sp.]MBQ1355509.1 hypothetical protein [Solobacterium sp.]
MMDYVFRTMADVEQAVEELGFLPFFANEIPGFSIEEHTPRELWFSDQPGPWEWKGPVISELRCAYGKFFHNKAVFISRKWFCDFANMRRDGYDYDARVDEGLSGSEEYLYNIIAARPSVLSKEAKAIGGYVKPRENGKDQWIPRKGFDTQITKLQMKCYVITTNFEYETDSQGNTYGWGIARYATPEKYLGRYFTNNVYKRKPEESRERVIRHLMKVTGARRNEIEYLIRG